MQDEKMQDAKAAGGGLKKAVFAGGCFWGVEHLFSQAPGVLDVVSGYSGGHLHNPSYEQVCNAQTGHAEAVEVTYDPAAISYEQLARLFFELHDPTQLNRQGFDFGPQYRSMLFYGNEDEQAVALELVAKLKTKGYDVVTKIVPATVFYPAEEYHQDYLKKHPGHACHLPTKRFD
jgi:peptide methionine sulfoxide reductase msrA/msrB